jgi:UDP-glucose 4-epimerase
MQKPEIYFRNNTASTLALLESILAAGPKRFVFSSTAAVYGEPESVPIPETAKLRPTNAYGESKLLVEHMLGWFHRIHGLRSASLRYFNVAGAPEAGGKGSGIIPRGEAHEPESHLIPLILDVALGRRKPSKSSATTTPPTTAPASATTSTSATSPTPTCSPSKPSKRPSRRAEAHLQPRQRRRLSPSKRSSTPSAASPATPSRSNSTPPPRRPRIPHRQQRKSHRRTLLEAQLHQIDEIIRTAWIWHQKRVLHELTYPHGDMQGGGAIALILADRSMLAEKYGVITASLNA